jgi:hypothetical protein
VLAILIGADVENSKAVFAALAKFGAPIEGLSAKDFAEPDNFFRMGAPPVMVDIMPKISGVGFEAEHRIGSTSMLCAKAIRAKKSKNSDLPFLPLLVLEAG